MKFMATLRDEQEFLEYAANQVINVFAMDSAVARALMAARENTADAHVHALLAQVSVLKHWNETRAAMEGTISMAFEGNERSEELARVRVYLGDPEASIVALQRELADIIAERGAYPL